MSEIARNRKSLKPFGLEFLEQLDKPAIGSQHDPYMDGGPDCCTTWMSTLSEGMDLGHYQCWDGVDMCV